MFSRVVLSSSPAGQTFYLANDLQGQVGWSSEQPGLVEDVPAHGRGVGT